MMMINTLEFVLDHSIQIWRCQLAHKVKLTHSRTKASLKQFNRVVSGIFITPLKTATKTEKIQIILII